MTDAVIAFLVMLALALLGMASASAAEVAWDYAGDPRVTHFRIDADGAEVARTADGDARSVAVDLVGGETLTAFACSDTACSPPSNELWIPNGVQNIRITWGLQ